jgi:hypothetical protein
LNFFLNFNVFKEEVLLSTIAEEKEEEGGKGGDEDVSLDDLRELLSSSLNGSIKIAGTK